MAKVTPSNRKGRDTVTVKTKNDALKNPERSHRWWLARSKTQRYQEILETFAYIKQNQQGRFRQAGIYARMYGNMPLFNVAGTSATRFSAPNNLPIDRPTMNVIQSCIDTKVSRITQDRPSPIFLTDNADYKERTLAKQMNSFIGGEFYQVHAYRLGEFMLRDADIFGTGCLKVYKGADNRVGVERVLESELFVDANDALYGEPRQMFHARLVDRSVLEGIFPEYKSEIQKAENAYPDASGDASKTIADQVIVVEAWHLPSYEGADDGVHCIVCSAGEIFHEQYKKKKFPFVFLQSNPRPLGFWGQGCPERLMGTQVEINKLLMTISQSINLVGVPRVFVEDGSKVVKAHLNNQIGSIVTYRGTKPQYEVAPCVPAEIYMQLQRLIDYAYQQEGISTLMATGQKPAGLNSGAAQRAYEDIQSDRFAALQKRYSNAFVDLAYQIIDHAIEIAEETGKYQTVFPNKDGTKQIDLPDIARLKDNPFVIQCLTQSSLPKDPAGRKEHIIEFMQAGLYTPQEGRRLLGFSDTEQEDKLLSAGEERIYKIMDQIVEDGNYTPPDGLMDLASADKISVQYYNLYSVSKLEDEKLEMILNFYTQVQLLKQEAQAAMAPPPEMAGQPSIPAAPEPVPQNPMLPQAPGEMPVG